MTLAVVAGVAIGLLLGALGGGGSILAVPVLVYGLGMDAREATTSSLVIVGVSSLVALVPHQRAGRVRVRAGLAMAALGVAGSWLGARAAAGVDPDLLLALFGLLLLLVAGLMVRRTLRARAGDGDPPATTGAGRRGRLVLASTAVGLLTGFFGVGGGFAIVPALVLVLGLGMRVAAATSLLVIALNSAVALALRAGHGLELQWPVVAVFTAATVAGSLVGGRLAGRIPATRLQLGFAALLVLIALYTLARSAPALL